jgi:citrate synthase
MSNVPIGLDDVVVAETELSDVDGERGELVVRGYTIENLVGHVSFEDACALLWSGHLPAPSQREQWRARLAESRCSAFERLGTIGDALELSDGMDALRASVAHLSTTGDTMRDAIMLIGATAVFAAAWSRRQAEHSPLAPDDSRAHAADYVRMVTGEAPTSSRVEGMDAYLCCVIDHGLNASTLAARVVASTASDPVSAVVAGIGALKGPLHGGAPGPVLDMLDAIGSPERTRSWLQAEITAGHRIMGMGHRVYRVRDPRAAALERAAARFEATGLTAARLALAKRVEREAEALLAERHPDRPLRANVEFYTAVLLEAIGIPRTLFSPTFAVSRVAGWCAHYDEQRRRGRLMRPRSKYVGPRPASPSDHAGVSAVS